MGMLIKYLLILFGIYFIGRAVIRSIVSYFISDATKKMGEQMNRQQEEMIRRQKKQEGRVTVDYNPKSNKGFDRNEGDYVDFEEVK